MHPLRNTVRFPIAILRLGNELHRTSKAAPDHLLQEGVFIGLPRRGFPPRLLGIPIYRGCAYRFCVATAARGAHRSQALRHASARPERTRLTTTASLQVPGGLPKSRPCKAKPRHIRNIRWTPPAPPPIPGQSGLLPPEPPVSDSPAPRMRSLLCQPKAAKLRLRRGAAAGHRDRAALLP